MKTRDKWVVVLLIAALPAVASGLEDPALFSIHADPSDLRPGETVTVWIDVTLTADWHIYSATTPPGGPYPTEIHLEEEGRFRQVGPIIQPPPLKEHDPNFDMEVEYYGKAVRFGVRADVTDAVPSGQTRLRGRVTYMLCNATSCLPPTTYTFEVPLQIVSGTPRPGYVTNLAPAPGASPAQEPEQFDGLGSIADVERAVSGGLGAFLYLAFSMGFLALLTPCVFPMVPITVSFFTKQETRSRAESVR